MSETFSGYCFDKDGFYPSPVTLDGIQAAIRYFNLQRPLHPRVMVTDSDDNCVMEAVNGTIVFPPLESAAR